MPKKLPAHVERIVSRYGRSYFYVRIGKKGRRIPLPSDTSSMAFKQAYAAGLSELMAGVPAPEKKRHSQPAAGTIGALVVAYMRSPAFRGLKESTRKTYTLRLEHLRRQHGHRSLAGLNRQRIVSGILGPLVDKPGAARTLLVVLRVLLAYGREIGWLEHSPERDIKRPRLSEHASWTDEEIAKFEERWPIGTPQRTAFALALYSAQRRADLIRLTWGDLAGGRIRVTQAKTGAKLTIPVHGDLQQALAAANRSHLMVLFSAHGRAYTVHGFGAFFRAAIRAAGLGSNCVLHGLRKAAARRLAEAGCTAHQIAAITGHKSLSEVARYTRAADQERLADAAILKLERKGNEMPQTASGGLGKTAKRRKETT